jgi:predicted transport protein
MSDIKLFRIAPSAVVELQGRAVEIEKTLQILMEQNLETFLSVRLLASEYGTGKVHGGRIDTLGLDELGAPVIIEYKRSLNENVINQGLFYLDWLLDHKGEFQLLIQERLGPSVTVDWLNPRLLCIASDFTKYDEYAVQQIDRNISLIRYKRFGNDMLILELVNATTSKASAGHPPIPKGAGGGKIAARKNVEQLLAKVDDAMRARFEALREFTLGLGDDVQMKTLQDYFAFTRIRNFACMEAHPVSRKILIYLKLDPTTLAMVPGFTRDVRRIGHFGTGDLEVTVDSDEDVELAQQFITRSYQSA